MTWQFYVIIFVLIIWFIHFIIDLGNKRIKRLKNFFIETGTPIVIESGHSIGRVIFLKYVNVSEEPIVGFEVMVEIENENAENTFGEYWVSLEKDMLYPFLTRTIKLEATLLDIKTQTIINVVPVKVQFLNGSFWNLK